MKKIHYNNICLKNRTCQMHIKAIMLFIGVFFVMFSSKLMPAQAEDDVITTHIWATKYDNTNHWEYCTLCGVTRNVTAHTFADNWFYGSESCNDTNYSTRICACGYNYIYRKPHAETTNWKGITNRLLHYNNCSSCGRWRQSERCYNYNFWGQKKNLGCNNPGTCAVCGAKPNKDMHFMIKGNGYGKCRDCNQNLFKMSNYTIEYAPDYSTATIEFTWTPVYPGFELTGSMGAYQDVNIFSSVVWKHTKNEDGSVTYTGVYTFHRDRQIKCNLNFVDRTDVGRMNGTLTYANGGFYSIPLWQDHTAPTVDSVEESDQLVHNSWATIKQLNITGKENLAKIVTLSILDKATGQVIVDKAKVTVEDGTYNYVCTPPLEGPELGRDYILRVSDEIGNTLNHTFTIYKTDSKPPTLESESEFTKWSQTKNITLDIADYGAAGVQTSLGDQYSYLNAPFVSGNLYRLAYKFKEENYGVTTYNLYMRDGLGNATRTTFTVGRVDNTKPTVTDIKVDEADDSATLTVTAHDRNEILGAEGSGVVGYALTKDVDIPPESKWQTSNVLTTQETGRMYLWVKDGAGNIADVRKINISESYIVDIKKDDMVIYDSAKKEKDKQNMKNNGDKKEDKLDDTPQTYDNRFIYLCLYFSLAVISSATLIIMERNKKRVFNENKNTYES